MRKRMAQQQAMGPQSGGGQGAGGGDEPSHFRHSGPQRQGASRGGSLRQMGGVGHLLRNSEHHKLTEKQEDALNAMRVEFELEKVDLEAALRKEQIKFRALVRNHDSAEADVLAAIDKVAACEAELRKMRYRHLKGAHGVLNEKQRKGLKTFHKERTNEKIRAFRVLRGGQAA